MSTKIKISAIFLFILALSQNLLNEVFNNNFIISLLYYLSFWVLSYFCFSKISNIVDSKLLKIAALGVGVIYPLIYSMAFIKSVINLGANESALRYISTLLSLIIFLLFSIGLFRIKEINHKKISSLRVISIIHTILFLVAPVLTFFSKIFFYGLLLPIFLYKKKEETVKLKPL